MLINLKELSTNAIETTNGIRKMRLSENAQSMVFQLFTKNVYSNPIGTVVREITSNCFDSHTEAGVNLPVVIRRTYDDQTDSNYISFIDFGVGMSPDRIYDIYGVYFESTKRSDNTQIGGFGIGGKTPLAYKRSTGNGDNEYDNSFYVITTYNGIKYYYCMFEGEDAPVISLLHNEPTTDTNGTEIRIPVLDKDMSTFIKELKGQLYYFENIVFEGFETYSTELSNEYQIIRGKNFLYRGSSYRNVMHICLGRVAYPIDYNVLGLYSEEYSLPIAIKLEVGSVNVTVSREAIDYSESTKKLIIEMLNEAKNEIIQLLTKQYDNVHTLEDYFIAKANFGTLKLTDNIYLNTSRIIKQSEVVFNNFKFKGLKVVNSSSLFNAFINISNYGLKRHYKKIKGTYDEIKSTQNLFYVDKTFDRKVIKQSYLKEKYSSFDVLTNKDFINNSDVYETNERFGVKLPQNVFSDARKGIIHPVLAELLELQQDYFDIIRKYCRDYNTFVVPTEYLTMRKEKRQISKDILKKEISARIGSNSSTSNVRVGQLVDTRYNVYYSTRADEGLFYRMSKLYSWLFGKDALDSHNFHQNYNKYNKTFKPGILLIMVSETNGKILAKCDTIKHISKFAGDILYRKEAVVTTFFKSLKICDEYHNLTDLYVNNNFDLISPTWGKKIKELNAFMKDYIRIKNKYVDIEDDLRTYFPQCTSPTYTFTEKKYLKVIEDLKFLMNVNENFMKYIAVPYAIKPTDTDFINLMKKLLVF